YLTVKFEFDELWLGCEKKVIFVNGTVDYPVRIVDDECKIPPQALTSSSFGVRIVGVGRGLSITTNTFTERQTSVVRN
ncbi:MAG: hypothetical protein J6Q84_07410, partial [Kiritimatiellae bacterium]|nr:hypothetical protein [Kiritimatiellia bacterium]